MTDQNNLLIQPNAFAKCAPNLSTNIRQCGTVTLCNAKAMKQSELANFTRSGDYLVMGALLKHEMEIKQCEAVQHGLYDFFMSNKQNLSKKLNVEKLNSDLMSIRPFVLAKQYSPINNEWWAVSGGGANGPNWQVDVQSAANVPPDTRSFIVGQRVYIDGLTGGGTSTKTAWTVVSATLINNFVRLVLAFANSGSALAAGRVYNNTTGPTAGLLWRGTNNVNDFEKFCGEPPAYLNWKYVPFWIETQRTSMCTSEKYKQWRNLLMAENPLYAQFGDLDDIEKNRQLAMDWQKRMLNTMIWGKPINAFQTVADYDKLDEIVTYPGGIFDTEGSKCIGKRANMVGMYEQLAQCGRVVDLQGAALDLIALFNELYQIIRVLEGQGRRTITSLDVFTDNVTAEAINTAMIAYYNSKSGNSLRLTYDVGNVNMIKAGQQEVQKAEFGFNFRSYPLFYPAIRLNVCTHYFFDDYQAASSSVGQGNVGRVLWVLDMPGIYPGIITSNRVVNKTGDLKTLAAIDKSFACVMRVLTQEQTLTSVTGTMVVECPKANLLLENFLLTGMLTTSPTATVYPPAAQVPTTTTTTSTTQSSPWFNQQQEFTASCPGGTVGEQQTSIVPAGEISSTVSQADADAKALAQATKQANDALTCT